MNTYISLLRGINVGGHRKIKMADLRKHYESLSFQNVRSYIQSGNLVFQSEESDQRKIENLISDKIKEVYGYDVPVIIRTKQEWNRVVSTNPFLDKIDDINFLSVSFLSDIPEKSILEVIVAQNTDGDRIMSSGKEFYAYTNNGFRNTRFTNTFMEKKFKLNITTRNWKTILKLQEILEKE
ncbi:MAG: DUF1697 domain-containing protein [Bacteroidales bacterium]|nr:DUF1697 domain-containing protein [Bacteroidales bacterium]